MAIINVIARLPNSEGEWEYNESVDDADFPTSGWVHNPDLSNVLGSDSEYWKWDGREVVLKDANELTVGEDDYDLFVYHNAGRLYCYGDDRWITPGDDNYGVTYYQWIESGGTNEDPIMEWEHQGHLVRAGDVLTAFQFRGRSSNTSVSEIEMVLAYRRPNKDGDVDNDSEMENTIIYRDNWFASTKGEIITGNSNDTTGRSTEQTFVVPEDGWITPYFGPTNTSSATRYMLMSYRLDFLRKRT